MRDAPVLWIALLVPLTITPNLLFYFDITPKVAILLIGVAIALLFSRFDLRPLYGNRTGRWFLFIVAFQWIWLALATALSTHRMLSINGGAWRRSGLITQTGVLAFAVIAAAWLREDAMNVRRLLRIWIASGALISLYGIAQYFGWDPLLPAAAYQVGEGVFTIVRPPGTLGHADYLGAWLALAVFCGPALARIERKGPKAAGGESVLRVPKTTRKFWSHLAYATSLLGTTAIILSGTRSALLGLITGAIVWLALERPRFSRKAIALTGACAAALAIFFVSTAGLKLRARVHWSTEDRLGGARLLLWRDSLRIVADHPLAGLGPETFGMEFPRHESLELARAYPDFYHESPHNTLLDLAVNQGLPALLAFLALCGLAMYAGYTSISPIRIPLLSGLCALLACQQFIVFTLPTEIGFYLVAGLLTGLEGPFKRPEPQGHAFAVPRFALALVFLFFIARSLAGDFFLAAAQRRIEAEDARGAAQDYRKSIRWQPFGTGADLSYSRRMSVLATRTAIFQTRVDSFQQAWESGVRATSESEDRQNAWYNLAALFAERNDAAGVERSLRNAIAWAPRWFKPHWTLAQLLDKLHRPEEALAEASTAVECDGGHDAEVAATWSKLAAEMPSKRSAP